MQVNIIAQLVFWVLLGLWFLGARFPYMEPIIGGIALFNGLLLIV